MRTIKVKLYFEEFEIEINDEDTILTALLEEGYEPPFSCQIGACASCKAKLLSGKVKMDENDALSDEEVEEGYILTCQSHPLTDDCFVDYDI